MHATVPIQDAILVFAVAGAALIWPPLALLVAAVLYLGLALLIERRRPPEPAQQPEGEP